MGVISGADMTVEAALTKLSHLLAGTLTKEQIKEQMSMNLRGELTVVDTKNCVLVEKKGDFLKKVADSLNVSSCKVRVRLHLIYIVVLTNHHK